jgi:dienelactone hydrolase
MKKYILFLFVSFLAGSLNAQITIDTIRYNDGDTKLVGILVKPKKVTSKTKTVIIVHEWWGLNAYPQTRAKQLAEEGYIAFCVDMYGEGKFVETPQDAQALAMPFYQDPQLLYGRFMAGYNALIADVSVNKDKMVAIGYCFGGSVVLNAAKMGAPVDAVVSFHGGLKGVPVDATKLTASVLVCNGAADSFVPQEDIDALQKDMTANSEDYTFVNYAESTHAFTNPQSTAVGKQFGISIAYNEAADKKSYADFMKFVKKKVK